MRKGKATQHYLDWKVLAFIKYAAKKGKMKKSRYVNNQFMQLIEEGEKNGTLPEGWYKEKKPAPLPEVINEAEDHD